MADVERHGRRWVSLVTDGRYSAKSRMYRRQKMDVSQHRIRSTSAQNRPMHAFIRNYADVLQHRQGGQREGENLAAKTCGVTPIGAFVTRVSTALRPDFSQRLPDQCHVGAVSARLGAVCAPCRCRVSAVSVPRRVSSAWKIGASGARWVSYWCRMGA